MWQGWAKQLDFFLDQWDIAVPAPGLDRVLAHWQLVENARRRLNLTTLRGRAALIRLILDSLSSLLVYRGQSPAIDIGSGAGYPGMVLAAVYPESRWTLVESIRKKAAFLTEAARVLSLDHVDVVAERAEALGRTRRNCYRWATARAVGSFSQVTEMALPLLAEGGHFLAMRGPKGRQEMEGSGAALSLLGARVVEAKSLTLPEGEGERWLIVVQKEGPTPEKFPRHGGSLGRFTQERASSLAKIREGGGH